MSQADRIRETTEVIRNKIGPDQPRCGIVLGSGLGNFCSRLRVTASLPYAELPHFRPCGVEGHAGNLIFGELNGVPVVCQQGRFHYYEGHAMADVVFPVRVMAALGIEALVVTNAAGGIRKSLQVGDLMVLTDHINFMGCNPLLGPNEANLGPRFPDMSHAYTPELRIILDRRAESLGIRLSSGVYLAVSGPSYETPAEIRMFRQWGADAVGMSTVPEVIAANHCGVQVLGLSCITNVAAGMGQTALNHAEVQQATRMAEDKFSTLLAAWVGAWATTTN